MVKIFILVFERIPLYFSYFFNKTDAHSIQAPFAYSFYQLCLKRKFKPIPAIELQREQYLKSKKEIIYFSHGKESTLITSSRGKVSKIASQGISDLSKSLLLASIVQQFKCGTIIELGTSLGINTSYLAEASPDGHIYTFEGNNELCQNAQNLFSELGYAQINLENGNIDETLEPAIEKIKIIDFVFIDANHSSDALVSYFRQMEGKLHENSIVVIDDIRWSKDMYAGWKKILENEKVSHSFDLGDIGFLFFKENRPQQRYILEY